MTKLLNLVFSHEAERYFSDGRRSRTEKELILEKCKELRANPVPDEAEELQYGIKRLRVGSKKILYEYLAGEKITIQAITPLNYIESLSKKY